MSTTQTIATLNRAKAGIQGIKNYLAAPQAAGGVPQDMDNVAIENYPGKIGSCISSSRNAAVNTFKEGYFCKNAHGVTNMTSLFSGLGSVSQVEKLSFTGSFEDYIRLDNAFYNLVIDTMNKEDFGTVIDKIVEVTDKTLDNPKQLISLYSAFCKASARMQESPIDLDLSGCAKYTEFDMEDAFRQCSSFENINIGDIGQGITKLYAGKAFFFARNLKKITMNITLENASTQTAYISRMFDHCLDLEEIDGVLSFGNIGFEDYNRPGDSDLYWLDTYNVGGFDQQFANFRIFDRCDALQTLKIKKFESSVLPVVLDLYSCQNLDIDTFIANIDAHDTNNRHTAIRLYGATTEQVNALDAKNYMVLTA